MTPEEAKQKRELINAIIDTKAKLREIEKETFKKTFYGFNKEVLRWPDIYEPLHKKVCDFVQENIQTKKILLLLPRGCFKSSIVTVGYSAWRIAQDPNDRGLIANATYPMAVNFLGQVKKILESNERFRELYGDLTENAISWREDSFALGTSTSYESKEATLSAVGIGSNVTGSHFDYALLDDLVNRDNIGTKDRIDQVINMYKDVLDLVDPLPNGHKPVIIVGTTWHQADLYSWIQDKDNDVIQDFAVMRLPAYTGEFGKGELLFPPRLTWEALESLRRNQGPTHFAAQYMLDPVPLEDATFKYDFKYYD